MFEKRALGAEIFRERKYPFLGHLRKDEKVAALTLTSMLTMLCANAGISNSGSPRQYCLFFNAASDVPLALLWAALFLLRCNPSGGCTCPDAKAVFNASNKQKPATCMRWLAELVGLELRNVVAKYRLERSHGFPGIRPNSGHRDYSRLSCGVWETQLGPKPGCQQGCFARALVDR